MLNSPLKDSLETTVTKTIDYQISIPYKEKTQNFQEKYIMTGHARLNDYFDYTAKK